MVTKGTKVIFKEMTEDINAFCPVTIPKGTIGTIHKVHGETRHKHKYYDIRLRDFEVCGQKRNWEVSVFPNCVSEFTG